MVGPAVRDDAIVPAEIDDGAALPVGVGRRDRPGALPPPRADGVVLRMLDMVSRTNRESLAFAEPGADEDFEKVGERVVHPGRSGAGS